MKKFYLWLTMWVMAVSLFAQGNAIIEFKETEHDFGTFSESEGFVSHTFTFTNKGDAPLVVNDVKPMCGCTSPEWTGSPIAPGKSGTIKVTFNATGRPYQFEKTITVKSNSKNGNVILVIKGIVTAKAAKEADSYPYSIGKLKLKTINLPFYDVSNRGTKTDVIDVYNEGTEPLLVRFDRIPSHLGVTITPQPVPPLSKATVTVTYKGSAIKDWGVRTDDIFVLLNNEKRIASDKKLTISANLFEDFSTLTPQQREQAPVLDLSASSLDFGAIKSGEKKTESFSLTNKGKSVLHIRKMSSPAPFVSAKAERMSVAPGKSVLITVTLQPTRLRTALNERLTIITNDPVRSTTVVRLTGSI